MKAIVNMITDRDEGVREAAALALCESYRQVGQRVRRDIQRVAGISPAKMSALMDRLDTVNVMSAPPSDKSDKSSPKSTRRSSGVPKSKGARTSSAAESGGVDPEEFATAMTSATPVYASSEADVDSIFRDLKKVLPDTSAEWEKRVAICRQLRGLINGNGTEFSNFVELIQGSGATLSAGVSDLRSAVSKEACVTCSQLSAVLGLEFESPLKMIIPVLLRQAQIHTKVLAQSARLCLEHVFATCEGHRLLQLLRDSGKHRAVEIRRAVYVSPLSAVCACAQLIVVCARVCVCVVSDGPVKCVTHYHPRVPIK
jgi:CLIP-associating protein 1/2